MAIFGPRSTFVMSLLSTIAILSSGLMAQIPGRLSPTFKDLLTAFMGIPLLPPPSRLGFSAGLLPKIKTRLSPPLQEKLQLLTRRRRMAQDVSILLPYAQTEMVLATRSPSISFSGLSMRTIARTGDSSQTLSAHTGSSPTWVA